ncbi:hypothetical protein CLAFUW4_11969 [Fulvia fulva]|uniref:Secreted protein n=1 Tax=Passalora fulva TaxID=5499 RepID=A0A9Q8PF50_PASFU|nr:uncharacterized protein CLAFUR5_11011 [Fulvia fulva]KAK4618236.1 hypothetical protein CLAFUR4_11974 [Fulvia fulva]KAK4618999.1 hypothetical protein CLAFUR0_11985 [Fulvia fulva]UJO21315.1 hypothetical protein CLAFUR5_11011 [Fulvia fulva]WPV18525.1 hypothetical protein CLAFUW4_11969 [Fulvia fulva]WPV32812.1 hypothetical protein CLAFUW7_11976 [Fulvia fulva]
MKLIALTTLLSSVSVVFGYWAVNWGNCIGSQGDNGNFPCIDRKPYNTEGDGCYPFIDGAIAHCS